jgi:hypothetical protein
LHVNYEYICAGIIVFLILSVTEVSMFNLMTYQLTRIEQENGYLMAEKILDILLLSPGDPPNWGSYVTDPISLGLAAQNSLEAYILDVNKVIRLSEDAENYISPGKGRRLLGLNKNYQFSLKITPVFLIDITSEGGGDFTLTLTNYEGFQLPNVNVIGYCVPKSLVPGTNYPSQSTISNIDGICTLNFTEWTENHVIVVCADQLGIKVVKTEPTDYNFYIEGDRVVESNTPLIQAINYSTGSVFGLKKESVFRYVDIGDFTYYVEFDLWS